MCAFLHAPGGRGASSTCTGRCAKREARGPERRRVGGSEGPPAKSLGYPFGNIIFEKSCPFGLGIPTPNCMNSPGIMFPKGYPSEIAGIPLWKHNFLRNPFHSEWGFPLQIEWISQKSCFLRGTPAGAWEGEPERRSVGGSECRSVGVSEHRRVGASEGRSAGVPAAERCRKLREVP